MTYPAMIAERLRIQARSAGVSAARLALQEMVDMNRNYVLVLQILEKEEIDVDRARRGSTD